MTRTYKTFKDIQKLTVFLFSRQVHLLKYFFMSILPIQMKVGGSLFLKTSRSKMNWLFSIKCLNLIAIWVFFVYGEQLYAEIRGDMHLYWQISLPIVAKKMKDAWKSLAKYCNNKKKSQWCTGMFLSGIYRRKFSSSCHMNLVASW